MAVERFEKHIVAAVQLFTALDLFHNSDDRFSVITLAGAADAILMQLAVRTTGTCLSDAVSATWVRDGSGSSTPARGKIASLLNKACGINALKHMDEKSDEFVDLDVEIAARLALVKALEHFRLWARERFPGAEVFEQQLRDEGFLGAQGGEASG